MSKQVKILLVDDDKDLLQVLQVALELNPLFKVTTCLNGQEACFKFRNEVFDVLVTDLKMPKMDGIELINTVNKIKNIPIFVISASISPFKFKMKEHRIHELKNVQVIPKPFDSDELGRKIKECMKNAVASNPTTTLQPDNFFKFQRGQIVFKENDEANEVYIIKEGVFSAFKKSHNGKEILLKTLRMGEVLGEIPAFTGGKRTTTLRADTDGVLIRIPMEKVTELFNSQPAWFKAILRTISMRLTESITALADARAEITEQEKIEK